MKYKALMLDVDGTLIPYEYDALPSDKVAQAIQKAQEKVLVCLVTGRSYGPHIQQILQKIGVTKGYVVGETGARIVNIATQEVIYKRPILPNDAAEIVRLSRKHKIDMYAKKANHDDSSYLDKVLDAPSDVEETFMFYSEELYSEKAMDAYLKDLSSLPYISAHKTRHKDPTKYGINIIHAQATKLHGVEVVMKETGIQKEEIIACGDSYNDFPLLMSAGTKVAMGNAIEDLKAIADYVAPPVTDDGLVDVIEKFILV